MLFFYVSLSLFPSISLSAFLPICLFISLPCVCLCLTLPLSLFLICLTDSRSLYHFHYNAAPSLHLPLFSSILSISNNKSSLHLILCPDKNSHAYLPPRTPSHTLLVTQTRGVGRRGYGWRFSSNRGLLLEYVWLLRAAMTPEDQPSVLRGAALLWPGLVGGWVV